MSRPLPQRWTITINGQDVDLKHLAPTTQEVVLRLRGGHIKAVMIEVSFANHCYSRQPLRGESIADGDRVIDGPRSAPRDRIFCPRRYALSLALPSVVTKLLSGQDDGVFESNHHNFIRVDVVEEASPSAPATTVTYYVFLSMRKAYPQGGAKLIKVFVESAYPEDVLTYDKPKLGRPVPFWKLLARCWEARPGADTGRRR